MRTGVSNKSAVFVVTLNFGTYIRHGDYLIPALTLPEEEEQIVIGIWGQRHLQYLTEYRRTLYLDVLTSYYRTVKEGKCFGRGRKNE